MCIRDRPGLVFLDIQMPHMNGFEVLEKIPNKNFKIIFSSEYQQMLGKNGLGPANSDYTSSLGDDQFAKALIESASHSKLTPAAPGWATVEASGKLEEFFSKIAAGGDVTALATEYDALLTPMLNGKQ